MAKFLFDNDLPPDLARALDTLEGEDGHEVKALRDVFSHSTPDLEWITKAGRQGWIILSKDRHQTKNPSEREALRQAKVTAIYLNRFAGRCTYWRLAAYFVRHWPSFTVWAIASERGSIGIAQENGKIRPLG